MAANRTTQAALTIALSLFVMLTFALGVTTYLFFTKRQEAEFAQAKAQSEAVEAQAQLQAIKTEMETLRGIIGVAAETPIADVETGLNDLFVGDFDGFKGEEKSYLKLIDWLRESFRAKTTDVKTAAQEKKDLEARLAAELKAAQELAEKAREAEQRAREDFDAASKQFAVDRRGHETQQKKLLDEKQSEAERARDLENLKTLILGVGDYLPPTRQEGLKTKPPAEQLEIIRNELRGQSKEIQRLNDVLAQARVANPVAQEALADLRSADDRVEGIDGKVVDVDSRSEMVLVSCRSTKGIRPGLVLHVFPPGDSRPQFGDRKGVVEVTEIEGPNTLRAVIRRESGRDPIVSGDGVASSLWGSGRSPAVVIVGFSDVDGDGLSDHDRLSEVITKAGGRLLDAVAADTAMLVDLGKPKGADDVPGWAAEEKRRDRAIKSAKAYGTRVGGIDTLLDMLGLDADSFAVGSLPRARAGNRAAPRR